MVRLQPRRRTPPRSVTPTWRRRRPQMRMRSSWSRTREAGRSRSRRRPPEWIIRKRAPSLQRRGRRLQVEYRRSASQERRRNNYSEDEQDRREMEPSPYRAEASLSPSPLPPSPQRRSPLQTRGRRPSVARDSPSPSRSIQSAPPVSDAAPSQEPSPRRSEAWHESPGREEEWQDKGSWRDYKWGRWQQGRSSWWGKRGSWRRRQGSGSPRRKDFPKEKPEGCRTVWIGWFEEKPVEEELRDFFADCGVIEEVRISDSMPRGHFAHVVFQDTLHVDEAMKKADEEFKGRRVFLDYAYMDKAKGDRKAPANSKRYKPKSWKPPDGKTLWCGDISIDAQEQDIIDLFEPCGKIEMICLQVNQLKNGKFGHIKFYETEAVDKAIEKAGSEIKGVPIRLDYAEDKPVAAYRVFKDRAPLESIKPEDCRTVWVGGLSDDVTEENIRSTFEKCGEIKEIRLDRSRRRNGALFCHVEFVDTAAVDKAARLNGERVLSAKIKVDFADNRKNDGTGRARDGKRRHHEVHGGHFPPPPGAFPFPPPPMGPGPFGWDPWRPPPPFGMPVPPPPGMFGHPPGPPPPGHPMPPFMGMPPHPCPGRPGGPPPIGDAARGPPPGWGGPRPHQPPQHGRDLLLPPGEHNLGAAAAEAGAPRARSRSAGSYSYSYSYSGSPPRDADVAAVAG